MTGERLVFALLRSRRVRAGVLASACVIVVLPVRALLTFNVPALTAVAPL